MTGDADEVPGVVEELVQRAGPVGQHGAVLHGQRVDRRQRQYRDRPCPHRHADRLDGSLDDCVALQCHHLPSSIVVWRWPSWTTTGAPTFASWPGKAVRYTQQSQFMRAPPAVASRNRSSTSSANRTSPPRCGPTRTSTSGCSIANARACSPIRSTSTPVKRKYGTTAIHFAPSRRARSSAADTPGGASDTKAASTVDSRQASPSS